MLSQNWQHLESCRTWKPGLKVTVLSLIKLQGELGGSARSAGTKEQADTKAKLDYIRISISQPWL